MEYSRNDDYNFVKWAESVKKRDFFTCQICQRYGVELNSHHMNGWNWCVEERYDIDNGSSLCVPCHNTFHLIYGKGKNTKAQYEEFKQVSSIFIKILEDEDVKGKVVQFLIEEIKKTVETDRVQAHLILDEAVLSKA